MGKMQRRKGSRIEYAVRDAFRLEGWEAHRVPLSGSAEGFKGDIIVHKGDQKLIVEVKSRGTAFKKVYEMYFEFVRENKDDLIALALDSSLVSISTSITAALENPDSYTFPEHIPLLKKYKRTVKKIEGMQQWLQGADLLVIKGDHKPLLYVRFKNVLNTK